MTDHPELDRRFVKPSHPGATIPDPDHRTDLPAAGCEVVWSHYWADHLGKGNIEVVEAAATTLAPTPRAVQQAPAKLPSATAAPAAAS